MRLSDVTIREASQMPGREYDTEQRVAAGRALDRLGVAYLQAGFAAAGGSDSEAIERLAADCDADVVSLARAVPGDVDAALDADADAIDVFAPLEARQLEHTVGKSRAEMLDALDAAIERTVDGGASAHVTLLDAFRTDPELVVDAADRFPDVECFGLADTVGARTPRSVTSFLDRLDEGGVDLSRVGVHFHDDLGVATANALVAMEAGVGKVDVSVASLGERAGNTSLEELVVAGVLDYDEEFGVDPERLIPACRDVLDALDEEIDPRKAVLGEEVTQHESPIHVAAMLSEPSTMEPFDPGRFGGERTLLFGADTGSGGARRLLERAGRELDEALIESLLDRLEDRGPLELDDALAVARECSEDRCP